MNDLLSVMQQFLDLFTLECNKKETIYAHQFSKAGGSFIPKNRMSIRCFLSIDHCFKMAFFLHATCMG